MTYKNPHLFIIGGPNGAGKTTSAMKLLPDFLQCEEYVNADGIASGLSQFRPESVAINAGRTMLSRIQKLIKQKNSFAFETTLASRSFVILLKKCKQLGYSTNVIFLWLQSPELAVKRVRIRVKNGGHSIPEDTVRRRYKKGINNLFKLYMPIADNWTIYDNSSANPELIAKKIIGKKIDIINEYAWLKIQEESK
jgi:predicted ABC-type ATPase